MMTKEKFQQEVKFDIEASSFILPIYSKLFDKEINFVVSPELEKKDSVSDRIIEIINDLYNLDSSNLEAVKKTVWKCFNRYCELFSFTLNIDDEQYEKNEISKEEYEFLNRTRQQDLYGIYNKDDCWNKIGEPEYQTCVWPHKWNHRFGFITFYPEWEEDGLNILVRNGEIIGYANGLDPIVKDFDNPKLKSVYELWS